MANDIFTLYFYFDYWKAKSIWKGNGLYVIQDTPQQLLKILLVHALLWFTYDWLLPFIYFHLWPSWSSFWKNLQPLYKHDVLQLGFDCFKSNYLVRSNLLILAWHIALRFSSFFCIETEYSTSYIDLEQNNGNLLNMLCPFTCFFTHLSIFLSIATSMSVMQSLKAVNISSIVFLSLNNEEPFTVRASGEVTLLAATTKSVDFFFS